MPRKFIQKVSAAVQTAPLTLPVGVAVFGTVAMFFLLIGKFEPLFVWLLGLEAAFIAAHYTHLRTRRFMVEPGNRPKLLIDSLVLLGVAVWALGNLPFTYQHVRTDRDPATYSIAAAWLVKHDNLHIATPETYQKLAVPGTVADSLGFGPSQLKPDELAAQGSHLLPVLLGLGGALVGTAGMLHLNVLIGALALLAMYGFGRTIVKPGWAALATLTMGLTLPLIYLSRDTYTEPLTMMSIFASLTMLHYALKTHKNGLWLLAGVVLGTTVLARIDGYLAVLAAELFAVIILAYAKSPKRWPLAKNLAVFSVGLAAVCLLAWLDVTQLSSLYYQGQRGDIRTELLGTVFIAALGLPVVIISWSTKALQLVDKLTRSWRTQAIRIAVPSVFLVLFTRPFWYIGYYANDARSFSEQTMNWIWWYVGPAAFVAGVAGLVVAIIRVLRGRNYALGAFLLMFSTNASLYSVMPRVTADQPWATRRFLPVVIPGFVLLAVLLCEWLMTQRPWRRWGITVQLQTATAVVATLVLVGPLFISYPFMLRRLYAPQLAQVQAVCQQTKQTEAVLWLGDAGQFLTQPVRTVCGVDTFGVSQSVGTQAATADLLKNVAARASAAHIAVIVGLYDEQAWLVPKTDSAQLTSVGSITYADIEHTYLRAPRNTILTTQNISLARLNADGTLSKLP